MISSAWWSTPARATRTWPGSARTPSASDVEAARAARPGDARGAGPAGARALRALLSPEAACAAMALQPFFGAQIGEWFVARTGYTGEDGFEIMLPARRGGIRLAAAECRRRALLRPRRARYAAAGGRHESVRQRHGRAAPIRSSRGLAWTVAFDPPRPRFHRPLGARADRARTAASASWSAWCSMSARCCAATSA